VGEQRMAEELEPAANRSATLFVRMWAVAHIVHLSAANSGKLDTPWNIAVVVCAIVLLRFPARGPVFVVMAVAQIVDLVVEMPYSPDHWTLIAGVNLAILATMVRRRSWDLPALRAAFPAARLILLVAYCAAALSKYNSSFIDPVKSCATAIAGTASFGLTRSIDAGPLWAATTLICETSIPLLLLIPATRRHGVRLGLAFHFMLSASPAFAVVDFTAALFALFLLFLGDAELGALLDRFTAVAARSAIARDLRRWPVPAMVLALLGAGFAGYLSPRLAAGLMLVPAELYLLAVLLVALWIWPRRFSRRAFGRLIAAQVAVAVLVGCWAASPYVGLRTTGVFTMFSGIRTEGDAPNHLFIPSMRLTDWQDDLVVIDSSNDAAFDSAGGREIGTPLMALRRRATAFPSLVVKGRLDGKPVEYGPGAGQTHLEPLPWWQSKLLLFRPVAVGDRPFCSMS
jgi:hypothetical protein